MKPRMLVTAKISLALSISWLFVTSATNALACKIGGSIADAQTCVKTPGPSDATVILPKIINTLLFFAGALAVFMVIYAGLTFVLSAGDDKKVASAIKTIINALIGLAITVLAYGIVNFVSKGLLGI